MESQPSAVREAPAHQSKLVFSFFFLLKSSMKISNAPTGRRVTGEQARASVRVMIQIANTLANQHIFMFPLALPLRLARARYRAAPEWDRRMRSLKETAYVRHTQPYIVVLLLRCRLSLIFGSQAFAEMSGGGVCELVSKEANYF